MTGADQRQPQLPRVRLRAAIALPLVILCALALLCAQRAAARGAPGAAAPPGGTPVVVAIDRLDPGRPVPPRFLGLSFEAAALGRLAQYAERGDLVTLLRSVGPGVLRFGGVSADESVAWSDALTPPPPWATSTIGPRELAGLAALARRSGWQVILTVGLGHYEPQAAAREVAAARRALGASLLAVEIGNEPNAYGRHGLRPLPWIAQGYEEEVGAYREAIAALTPGIPIAGPDVSGSGLFAEWGEEEALAQTPALLTGHHYPLGCAQTPPPSIEALLSRETRGRAARSLARYMSVARAHGIPLRIDETNTVSCGGVAGISDTFAAALWATGYITQAMTAGTVGVNLHGHPASCRGYSPLCAPDLATLAAGALTAQPEWYALLLTSSLIGDRPLPTRIFAAPQPDLVAAAFLTPAHALEVALVDDDPPGSSPLALRLRIGPGMGRARLLALTAPAPSATGGVRLGGRAVAADGSWRVPAGEPLVVKDGTVALTLEPSSAALLGVQRRRPSAPRSAGRSSHTVPHSLLVSFE